MVEDLWQRVRHPTGPTTRALWRAGTSALGTYAAYVSYGLFHPSLMRPSASAAERARRLPGDELVAQPSWVTDFAIDIAAAPPAVWPWLIQIGYGRAGWYTWFPLDNGGAESADRIRPELQTLAVGDLIPDGPRAAEGFGLWRVHALERDRCMVLHSRRNVLTGEEMQGDAATASHVEVSWVFALVETAPARTRLHVRVRARLRGPVWVGPVAQLARLIFGVGDSVMEGSMLEGIRARAEGAGAAS